MTECIFCGHTHLYKNGIRNNVQRYTCPMCHKRFAEDTNPNRGKIINGERYCPKCDTFKPLSEFGIRATGKFRPDCKLCTNQSSNSRFTAYGLNEADFDNLINNQKNKCAICDTTFKSKRNTFIDHNHTTGYVRELLCPKCNLLIGLSNDNIEILNKAILYLIKHQ